jgi:excisionase family DNA binding protein
VQREPSFLTTGEIAKCCQVGHVTVSNWIRAGKLRASRTPGGHARVQREDFVHFLVEHNFPIPDAFRREGKRILVVDDEHTLVEAIAQNLQAEGYQVSVAFDGYTAGVKMATVQPDLLVLDLIMPGVDGFSVCKRVKADPATRRTKILAMTGFVQEGNVAKALECGADLCLEKPFRVESLKTSVARLLGQRRAARTLQSRRPGDLAPGEPGASPRPGGRSVGQARPGDAGATNRDRVHRDPGPAAQAIDQKAL